VVKVDEEAKTEAGELDGCYCIKTSDCVKTLADSVFIDIII